MLNVTPSGDRRPFNNDYIPFLQRYSEYDSFPSLEDREIMAQKSGMTARQIEVWFQNHRRVARKTGAKIAKRQPSDSGYMAFTFVDQPTPTQRTSEEKMNEIEQQVRIEAAHQDLKYKSVGAPRYTRFANARDFFDQPAPSYVFPVTFNRPLESEQFQHRNWRSHFPPPQWMRRPMSSGVETPQSEEDVKARQKELRNAVKEMRMKFAHLSVRDTTKVNPGMPPAATFAVYLTPAPAPHPALERSTSACNTGRRKKISGLPKRSPRHPPRHIPNRLRQGTRHHLPLPRQSLARLPHSITGTVLSISHPALVSVKSFQSCINIFINVHVIIISPGNPRVIDCFPPL
ncbi:hypothetical protein K435DRAFT_833421 [Dendrothele bispora CBS 962.96]|uniref:Homeobox domain-containing protein n=1 Tax=Dendrothele bispora (strain CBS 962.96) TaxID=1314807 RepID=A0A4S8MW64_DENBC|nr:hypothetical protein K435DRAFT_833421 [Dendrothele bispora CBS 962.96]